MSFTVGVICGQLSAVLLIGALAVRILRKAAHHDSAAPGNTPGTPLPARAHLDEKAAYIQSTLRERHSHVCRLDAAVRAALCSYDPAALDLQSLSAFQRVKEGTHCVFARRARLWGSPDWDENETLAGNLDRAKAALTLFTASYDGINGFLLRIPVQEDSLEAHVTATREALVHLRCVFRPGRAA